MKFISTLLAIAFAATATFAQPAQNEAAAPELMKDANGNPMKMDFSLPLSGISDPGMLFSHFSGKGLLIFYFSPKCPHCQAHFPPIQSLIKSYEPRGLIGMGISIGGSIKKNDVRLFMDQLNASIPIFQDGSTKFGPEYGTGYVPVVFVVNKSGTFYRFPDLSDAHMDQLKALLDKMYPAKK